MLIHKSLFGYHLGGKQKAASGGIVLYRGTTTAQIAPAPACRLLQENMFFSIKRKLKTLIKRNVNC